MKIKVKDPDALKKKIISSGYNISQFAIQLGISYTHMHGIVSGKSHNGAKLSKKICSILNCEFDDIFFIDTLTKVS